MSRSERPLADRFWEKVDKNGPVQTHVPELASCWIWTAWRNKHGYGAIQRGSRGQGLALAHRVGWELVNGPIAEGMNILHRCDNPSCVRPDHLFMGTLKDNSVDMVAKGRSNPCGGNWARGEKSPVAKLTDEKVRQIRASDDSLNECAKAHGVSKKLINEIRKNRIWRHVQ